ncbi:MAG: ABC transporter substrate-binding protein [Clostridium sp.]|jgi:ABC-type amino acid transport substrate-binding protein|nr:ABC transporter substrate-binding protein [Clostridium sp.]
MKRLIKILVLISVSILLFGCGKKEDTLVMVTEAGFEPYEYVKNNEIVGVDVDIAREIAREMGKKLEIKDVAFDSIVNELNSNKADFAAAGMSITEERKKEVDFSAEYISSKQVIVVNKNNNTIKSKEDLNSKTISVQTGTVGDTYVSKNFKNAKIIGHKKFLTAAEDVKANKSDCIVMDELPAKELVSKNPTLTILNIELVTDRYAIAVKKGNTTLLNTINKVLDRLMKEGKIEEYVINHSS